MLDGSLIYRVHTDGGVKGWMTGSALLPRDSIAPRVWEVEQGSGAFSPNGDGSKDTFPISVRLSESSSWTLRVENRSGDVQATASGVGDHAALTWAPAPGSKPDGTYRWVLGADDAWGNGPMHADGDFRVDTAAPQVSVGAASAATVPQFSPNGDGYRDTIGFAVGASESGRVLGSIRDASNAKVTDSLAVAVGSGTAALAWDGRRVDGSVVADGLYTISMVAEDEAGNRSEPQLRTVAVYGSLGRVRSSAALFFPQDRDNLAQRVTFAFDLARAATVTWTVTNAAGTTVRTIMTDRPLQAGTQSFSWDGRNDAGAYVPRGTYTTLVLATSGDLAAAQAAGVRADAFSVAVSDSTPGRHQRITVTIRSAEKLSAAPRLAVYQPGIGRWSVKTTRVSPGVYRVRITLRSSRTGAVRLQAYGVDSGHRSQSTVISLPLH